VYTRISCLSLASQILKHIHVLPIKFYYPPNDRSVTGSFTYLRYDVPYFEIPPIRPSAGQVDSGLITSVTPAMALPHQPTTCIYRQLSKGGCLNSMFVHIQYLSEKYHHPVVAALTNEGPLYIIKYQKKRLKKLRVDADAPGWISQQQGRSGWTRRCIAR